MFEVDAVACAREIVDSARPEEARSDAVVEVERSHDGVVDPRARGVVAGSRSRTTEAGGSVGRPPALDGEWMLVDEPRPLGSPFELLWNAANRGSVPTTWRTSGWTGHLRIATWTVSAGMSAPTCSTNHRSSRRGSKRAMRAASWANATSVRSLGSWSPRIRDQRYDPRVRDTTRRGSNTPIGVSRPGYADRRIAVWLAAPEASSHLFFLERGSTKWLAPITAATCAAALAVILSLALPGTSSPTRSDRAPVDAPPSLCRRALMGSSRSTSTTAATLESRPPSTSPRSTRGGSPRYGAELAAYVGTEVARARKRPWMGRLQTSTRLLLRARWACAALPELSPPASPCWGWVRDRRGASGTEARLRHGRRGRHGHPRRAERAGGADERVLRHRTAEALARGGRGRTSAGPGNAGSHRELWTGCCVAPGAVASFSLTSWARRRPGRRSARGPPALPGRRACARLRPAHRAPGRGGVGRGHFQYGAPRRARWARRHGRPRRPRPAPALAPTSREIA